MKNKVVLERDTLSGTKPVVQLAPVVHQHRAALLLLLLDVARKGGCPPGLLHAP
jgi:hypothetical protein